MSVRDVMRETLMSARMCRRTCYEVASCDCAQDTLKQLSALDAAGFAVVPKEPTDRMIIRFMEETESDAYELAIAMYKAMLTAAEGEP